MNVNETSTCDALTHETITFDDVKNNDNKTFDVVNVARALNIDCKRARARMRANERIDDQSKRIACTRINNVHTYDVNDFANVVRIIANKR